ncbi:hypothetical protein C8Q80DRAFT_25375 [Daedaleopsis nitida]|nr:hypothetical protein C8Q80DRAFT_25375 [Daedaleopsis nitida]
MLTTLLNRTNKRHRSICQRIRTPFAYQTPLFPPLLTLVVISVMNPPSPLPPPTNGTPKTHILGPIQPDHIFSSDAGSHGDVSGWPWCQSCRPYIQILLSQHAQAPSSFVGHAASAPATMTLSSPFPDYICVPALVHRSQLALLTTTTTTTTTSTTNAASPSPVPEHPPSTGAPPSPTTSTQRRTRGVKVACTNCRTANKRCDEGRPCTRCIKYGQEDKCVSAERKQRRRTIKHVQTATAITVSAGTTAGEDVSSMGPTAVHIAAAAPRRKVRSWPISTPPRPSTSASATRKRPAPPRPQRPRPRTRPRTTPSPRTSGSPRPGPRLPPRQLPSIQLLISSSSSSNDNTSSRSRAGATT